MIKAQFVLAGIYALVGVGGLGITIFVLLTSQGIVDVSDYNFLSFPVELTFTEEKGLRTGALGCVVFIPILVVAYGVYVRSPAAKVGAIGLSVLLLLVFPFGVPVGLLGLWAFLWQDAKDVWGERERDMTDYPQGHGGYRGRSPDAGSLDNKANFEEINPKGGGKGCGVAALVVVVVTFVGVGIALQTGALDNFDIAVRAKSFLQSFSSSKAPTAKAPEDDLKIKDDDKKVRVERVLEEVHKSDLGAPQSDEEMKGMFQFVDEWGVTHIVDHYSRIPRRYRKTAKRLNL